MPRASAKPAGRDGFHGHVARTKKEAATAGVRPGRGFTVADVAKLYAVGTATVIQWIRSNELRAVNVSRSRLSKKPRWRITQSALDAFEAARGASAPPERKQRRRPSGGASYYPE